MCEQCDFKTKYIDSFGNSSLAVTTYCPTDYYIHVNPGSLALVHANDPYMYIDVTSVKEIPLFDFTKYNLENIDKSMFKEYFKAFEEFKNNPDMIDLINISNKYPNEPYTHNRNDFVTYSNKYRTTFKSFIEECNIQSNISFDDTLHIIFNNILMKSQISLDDFIIKNIYNYDIDIDNEDDVVDDNNYVIDNNEYEEDTDESLTLVYNTLIKRNIVKYEG